MLFTFALDKAGNSIAAKIAIIAITTNSSINVKALRVDLGMTPLSENFNMNCDRHIKKRYLCQLYLTSRPLFSVSHGNQGDVIIRNFAVWLTVRPDFATAMPDKTMPVALKFLSHCERRRANAHGISLSIVKPDMYMWDKAVTRIVPTVFEFELSRPKQSGQTRAEQKTPARV